MSVLEAKASVGASGAHFGLLGAMLSELLTNWTIYANKLVALLMLILIITVNLPMGLLPGVHNFADIEGFLTGFFLGFMLLIRPQFRWISQQHPPPGCRASSLKPKHRQINTSSGLTLGLIMPLWGANAFDYCQWSIT
ncbi:Peptidase S54, rhomboid domain [Dillenia turbinata]|uniref:RHOMBOID-like protein n=1 Tax=Dillenia turbinata TaxID=194707 RepID=A0AAN8ZF85_9MAGN